MSANEPAEAPSPDFVRAALALHDAGHRVLPTLATKEPHPFARPFAWMFSRPPTREWVGVAFIQPNVAGIGLLTGFAFDVLDVEADALDWLDGRQLPVTPCVRTQGGGMHFYFAPGVLRNTVIADGLRKIGEVRSRGWYVVAPPSRGECGSYAWEAGRALGEVPLGQPPAWLVELVSPGSRRSHGGAGAAPPLRPPVTPPSPVSRSYASRSEEDCALARRLHLAGVSPAAIIDRIAERPAAFDRGAHGLAYAERTVASATSWADEQLAAAEAAAFPAVVTRVEKRDERRWFVTFKVMRASGEAQVHRLLDWPVTARSQLVWGHLCGAVGCDDAVHPRELIGRRLRVELTADGRLIKRFFALEES